MQKKYITIFHSTVGVYAEFFIGFAISIILSRYFSTNEYGIYTFVNSVTTLVVILVNSGISLSAIRLVSKYDEDPETVSQTVKILRKKLNIRNLILTLLTILYFFLFYNGADISIKIVMCFMAGSFFKAQYIYLYSVQKGAERFDLVAKTILILGTVNFLLIVAGVFFKQPLEVFFIIYFAISFSFYILSSYYTKKYVVKNSYPYNGGNNTVNQELSIVKPLAIISLCSFFITRQSEVFFLKALAENETVALFSVPFNLYSALSTLIPGILINVLLPNFSKQKGPNVDSQKSYLMVKSLRYVSFLTIPISAYIISYGDEIITFIYGVKYTESSSVFKMIIVSLYFLSSIAVFNSYMITVNREKTLMNITIVSSIMTLVLDYIMISKYSLQGAAYAYLIGICGMYIYYIIVNSDKFFGVIDVNFNIKLIAISGISVYIVSFIAIDNLFFKIVVSFLLYLLLMLILIFLIGLLDDNERNEINKLIKWLLPI